MNPLHDHLTNLTRRQFFGTSGLRLGGLALALMGGQRAIAGTPANGRVHPPLPGFPHHPPTAKSVIYLHMNGGPSQMDLWDYKPQLGKLFDKDLPDSIRMGQRITTMTSGQARLPVAPSLFKFAQHGQCGRWVSELLPHTAKCVDDIALVKSVHTNAINHDPACTFVMTGSEVPGESNETLDLYGREVRKPGSFAASALLARRLVERGVRVVQILHRGWDQHNNLPRDLRHQCSDTDQPTAALLTDLKRRGLLDSTLVVWGGEFGRTVYSQGRLTATDYGRDHHPRNFCVWLAGGGVKGGVEYGDTDEFSYNV